MSKIIFLLMFFSFHIYSLNVLYVKTAAANPDDDYLMNEISNLGHTLTVVDDATDPYTYLNSGSIDVIYISHYAEISSFVSMYQNTAVGIVAGGNSNTWSGLGMIYNIAEYQIYNDIDVTVRDGSHPLLNGLGGTTYINLFDINNDMNSALLSGEAQGLCYSDGNTNLHFLFAFEKNSTLADSTAAPGRRVGFFYITGTLTADGRTLLDNALTWAGDSTGGLNLTIADPVYGADFYQNQYIKVEVNFTGSFSTGDFYYLDENDQLLGHLAGVSTASTYYVKYTNTGSHQLKVVLSANGFAVTNNLSLNINSGVDASQSNLMLVEPAVLLTDALIDMPLLSFLHTNYSVVIYSSSAADCLNNISSFAAVIFKGNADYQQVPAAALTAAVPMFSFNPDVAVYALKMADTYNFLSFSAGAHLTLTDNFPITLFSQSWNTIYVSGAAPVYYDIFSANAEQQAAAVISDVDDDTNAAAVNKPFIIAFRKGDLLADDVTSAPDKRIAMYQSDITEMDNYEREVLQSSLNWLMGVSMPDNQPPQVTLDSVTNMAVVYNGDQIYGTHYDSDSGIYQTILYISDTAGNPVMNGSEPLYFTAQNSGSSPERWVIDFYTALPEGEYYMMAVSWDNAGNSNYTVPVLFEFKNELAVSEPVQMLNSVIDLDQPQSCSFIVHPENSDAAITMYIYDKSGQVLYEKRKETDSLSGSGGSSSGYTFLWEKMPADLAAGRYYAVFTDESDWEKTLLFVLKR